MSTNRTPHRVRRLGVIALAALASTAVAGNVRATSVPGDTLPADPVAADSATVGDSTPTGGAITVLSTGDPATMILLPGMPEVGARGTVTSVSTATGTIVASGSDDSEATIDVVTTITQDGEVVAADDDGFDMRRVVTSYDVVDSSIGASGDSYASDRELADLVDVPLIGEVAANGALLSLSAAPDVTVDTVQQAAIDEAFEGSSNAGFPDVELGVGAQWSTVLDEEQGLTATYTLSAIDGDDFTIDIALKGSADQLAADGALPEGFDELTGTITGSGQYNGRLGEPFVRTAATTLNLALTFSGPGIEVTSDITMVEDETIVPA